MEKRAIMKACARALCVACLLFAFAAPMFTTESSSAPLLCSDEAAASVTVGNSEPIGWKPDEMISSDTEISVPENAAVTLEGVIVRLVQVAMPFLMLACVAIIVYNAVANIFRPKERRVKMGDLIKNMFVNFFWILFAWVIVEAIVFVITNGETILFNVLLGY